MFRSSARGRLRRLEVQCREQVPAGRARRFHALFAIPRGATLARVLYHDDDFPTCLSAPRITYPEPACRPRPQPVDHVTCRFFER